MLYIAFILLVFIVTSNDTSIVYPKLYTSNIQWDLTRDYVEILDLDGWIIELIPNEELIIGKVFVNDLPRNDTSDCRYLKGFDSSNTAVSICDDNLISGLLLKGQRYYIIEPIDQGKKHHLQPINETILFPPKRQKRSIGVVCGTTSFDNLKTDDNSLPDDDFSEDLQKTENDEIFSEDPDIMGYFHDSTWETLKKKKKKVQKYSTHKRWLEIALGIDYSVISFHGIDKVTHYVLTLMNIVSAVYQDPSLESNLQLVITRLMLYPEKKHGQVAIKNATKSLENVNSWNRRLHSSFMAGESRHDVAVWLTRLDIGGPSGYAPVAGACNPVRSCTLNRDEGLTCAFIIAHEMAHLLGLTHDGDKKAGNNCGAESQEGSVMAPVVAATFNKFTWSSCSKREFHKKISSWPCLMNPPKGHGSHTLQATLQASFSMDEQCRIEFGEGYHQCTSLEVINPCGHLWCQHVNNSLFCKTKKGPPLEGTQCGTEKWCISGYCRDASLNEPMNEDIVLHNPRDGGWGNWTEWQPCSRTCGFGAQFRTRNCNNPKPAYGGNHCVGKDEEFRICGLLPCSEPLKDFRAEQCKRLGHIIDFQGSPKQNMTWLPHEPEPESLKCRLICRSKQTSELFHTEENYIDGTKCSYDSNDGICIQGECHSLSCNGNWTSEGPHEDWCGVCAGDNSLCQNISTEYQKNVRKEESRILVLPRLARNIIIESTISTVLDPLDESITLYVRDRRKFRYDFIIGGRSNHTIIIKGAKFNYRKSGNIMKLWAKGPTLAELIVFLYAPASTVNSGLSIRVNTSYSAPGKNGTSRFIWEEGGWGPCSVSCGGGKRQRTIACRDQMTGNIVPRRRCPLNEKPLAVTQECNTFSCRFRWQAGEWEFCSATCGNKGVKNREVYCVPQMANNSRPWIHMVKPDRCKGVQPETVRPCNRIPCPGKWNRIGWSQCSATCGRGHKNLNYNCLPVDNSTSFIEESECSPLKPIDETRSCRGRGKKCRIFKRLNCKSDRSQYCVLTQQFSKYCTFPPFRRLCCHTCNSIKHH